MYESFANTVSELQNGVRIKRSMEEIFEVLICVIIASHVMPMCDVTIIVKNLYELLLMRSWENGE